MVLLFLYHRLFLTAKRQLECLRRRDYGLLERLTLERDDVTRELCETIAGLTEEQGREVVSEAVRRKIHDLTAETLRVDAQIKDLLLKDLRDKTLELDRIYPNRLD